MDLYTTAKGNPDHPAVVCVHGLLGSSRNLLRIVQEIANAGFYVISYDQRGHGHSPHAVNHEYSLQGFAEDLLAVLDSKGIKQAHLVGHSLGGRVSLAATALAPNRVKSLTMLDVGARIHPDSLKNLLSIINPLPDFFSTKEEAKQAFAHYSTDMQLFLISNLRHIRDRFEWIFDLPGARFILTKALASDQMQAWKGVQQPVLLVRGAESEHFKQSELELMLSENSHAKSSIIANAEHWLHVDNLVDTSRSVITFLNEVENG